jgi:hypothetical protein
MKKRYPEMMMTKTKSNRGTEYNSRLFFNWRVGDDFYYLQSGYEKYYEGWEHTNSLGKISDYHASMYKNEFTPGYTLDRCEAYEDKNILEYTHYIGDLKMNNNKEKILNCISKMKANTYKKYQISGYREWKQLSRELNRHTFINFWLVFDKNLTKNTVVSIKSRIGDTDKHYTMDNTQSRYDNWRMMKYENGRVPIMYIEIHKLDYSVVDKKCKIIKDELLAKIYHPDRISKINDYDYLR